MLRIVVALLLCTPSVIAGRFDARILESGAPDALRNAVRRASLDYPVHTAAAAIAMGEYKFAGVYIGNRMVLTAAHCISGLKPAGATATFTTYAGQKSTMQEQVVASARVVDWQAVQGYKLGQRDYGLIILDRDPAGIVPAKIWTNKRGTAPVPNRTGIIISPVAEIDVEVFQGEKSAVRTVNKQRCKHAYHMDLLFGDELPHAMKNHLSGPQQKIMTGVMREDPRYQVLSKKIYGKTRTGDSGAPIFVEDGGQYYLAGLVSGGYVRAQGVHARHLAELYVHLGSWYHGEGASVSGLCRRLLRKRIVIEEAALLMHGRARANRRFAKNAPNAQGLRERLESLRQGLKIYSAAATPREGETVSWRPRRVLYKMRPTAWRRFSTACNNTVSAVAKLMRI